jgi:hypothetical protein
MDRLAWMLPQRQQLDVRSLHAHVVIFSRLLLGDVVSPRGRIGLTLYPPSWVESTYHLSCAKCVVPRRTG